MFLCVCKNRCRESCGIVCCQKPVQTELRFSVFEKIVDDDNDAEIRSHFLARSNAVSGGKECAVY